MRHTAERHLAGEGSIVVEAGPIAVVDAPEEVPTAAAAVENTVHVAVEERLAMPREAAVAARSGRTSCFLDWT